MMDALTIFGEDSFIFNFVGYGLVTKSLGGRVGGLRAHLRRCSKKKMSKDECDFCYNKIR